MTTKIPAVGDRVLYVLGDYDAKAINKRRADAKNLNAAGVTLASQGLGPQIHVGNSVQSGDVFPAVVVRAWGAESVNVQVLLDGNDTLWGTSRPHDAGGTSDTPGAPAERSYEGGTWHWAENV